MTTQSLQTPPSLQVTQSFDQAIQTYKAAPSAESLLLLNKAAIPLLEVQDGFSSRWNSVQGDNAFSCGFSEVRVVADRSLDAEDVSRLSGCLGYALRQSLAGEDLSEPSVSHLSDYPKGKTQMTVLEYFYDSTKSRRDDPDYGAAFELAQDYIPSGSPVRSTSRAGAGTKGTRLVEGIGLCNLSFYVR